LLSQIEIQQIKCSAERFINLHLYMTSAKYSERLKTNNKMFSNDFFLELKPGRPDIKLVKFSYFSI